MNATVRWLLAIGALLAANIVAMVILAASAGRSGAQVIPAYYEQAVHYDDKLDDAARSAALRWSIDVQLVRGAVDVDVRDVDGHPLAGAQVLVAGYQRAHAAQAFEVRLDEIGAGHYRGPGAQRDGLHDLQIVIVHHGNKYTRRVSVEAR